MVHKQRGGTTCRYNCLCVKFIADDLNVNTASRILMYDNSCDDVGIPTGFLTKYEQEVWQ